MKILAVAPEARRRGLGSVLLADAIAAAPGQALRMGDHPGNYLSPGVDERDAAGLAFLAARGFVEKGRVENLRTPYADNELLAPARSDELVAARRRSRLSHRASAASELADACSASSAPSSRRCGPRKRGWRYAGPRHALFCAFTAAGAPVAFAAADGNNQGLGWFGPAGTEACPPRQEARRGLAAEAAC